MKTALAFALPLALAASHARADQVPVAGDASGKVTSLAILGCGPGVQAHLEPGQVMGAVTEEILALDFDGFSLGTEDHQSRLACVIDAVVKVPAGKRFCIRAASVHGYADLRDATATLGFDYALRETRDLATAERQAPAHRITDLEVAARLANPGATPCRDHDAEVHMSGSVWLDLASRQDDGSAIRVTGQGSGYGVGWVWGFADCPSGGT